ncbi:MAG TPA: hypothetical protein DCP49_08135, partial [Erysipelotrichaceae bacterium]|nr:hypothetical protein [Erysipelotrichaceae bacterium]
CSLSKFVHCAFVCIVFKFSFILFLLLVYDFCFQIRIIACDHLLGNDAFVFFEQKPQFFRESGLDPAETDR